MKKMVMILSLMGTLLLATACSEQATKETEKDNEQVESEKAETDTSAVIDDETAEEIPGDVEYVEAELPDKPEYNQIFSIFLDDQMEESFKKLVGEDLDIFRVTFQQITPVPTDDESVYAFHGYMPGLEGVAEGVVIFDDKGKMWAATSEGENVNFYSNSGDVNQHHPIIEDWRMSFFSGSPVVYKGQ
ncbi:hypothetical protein NEOCIP111885_03719 [Pseudoneobacillus rhizosphaerae]|uniref:Uncharacterized protein n=2 Tax=Pseudoneobacillus rhizosphaerae TaxID=2880968 RepID=A0A9C7LBB5_9BACI|nr:hypothetical protein NEOCIP111885_03719 [Pseudoneobacillus rhizosphaerae]